MQIKLLATALIALAIGIISPYALTLNIRDKHTNHSAAQTNIDESTKQPHSTYRPSTQAMLWDAAHWSAQYATWSKEQFRSRAQQLSLKPLFFLPHTGSAEVNAYFSQWARIDPSGALAFIVQPLPADTAAITRQAVFSILADVHLDKILQTIDQAATVANRYDLETALLAVLVEIRPPAAFNFAQTRSLFRSEQTIKTFFSSWASQDPQLAAEAVLELPFAHQQSIAAKAVATQWANIDRNAAWAWLISLDASLQTGAIQSFLAALAVENGSATLTWAEQLENEFSGEFGQSALLNWAKQSPYEALNWANQLEDADERSLYQMMIGAMLIEKDPQFVAGLIETMDSSTSQSDLLGDLIENWVIHNPKAMMEWLISSENAIVRETGLLEALRLLAQADVALAIEYLNKLPSEYRHPRLLKLIAAELAKLDPTEAMRWAEEQAGESLDNSTQQSVLDVWAKSEPITAMAAAQKLYGQQRQDWINTVGRSWGESDPEQSLDWIDNELDEEERPSAMSAAIMGASYTNYTVAADYLEKLLKESGGDPDIPHPYGVMHPTADAATQIAEVWDQENLRDGVEWAAGLPASESRDSAYWYLLDRWSEADTTAAMSYIAQMPPDNIRHDAAISVTRRLASNDLPTAYSWAANMASTEMRVQLAEFVYDLSSDIDPQVAWSQLVDSHLFTTEEIEMIVKKNTDATP